MTSTVTLHQLRFIDAYRPLEAMVEDNQSSIQWRRLFGVAGARDSRAALWQIRCDQAEPAPGRRMTSTEISELLPRSSYHHLPADL